MAKRGESWLRFEARLRDLLEAELAKPDDDEWKRPDRAVYDQVGRFLRELYVEVGRVDDPPTPEPVECPFIFPTPEGGISLEWPLFDNEWGCEIIVERDGYFAFAIDCCGDAEGESMHQEGRVLPRAGLILPWLLAVERIPRSC